MVVIAALFFQNSEGGGAAAPAGSSHGEFAHQNGEAQNGEKQQIDEDEGGPAELAADVGEFPDIADSHGAPGGHQNEAQPGAEGLAVVHENSSLRRFVHTII